MSTRDQILDAFEQILIADGEGAATLDAVAARAGVSKGGLLYHFRSKDALTEGLLERLRSLAAEDLAAMAVAPEGPTAHYLRTSTFLGTPCDQALVASTRLGGGSHPAAAAELRAIQEAWFELVVAELGDPAVARAILLMGDGLYYNAALGGPAWSGDDPEASTRELLGVVDRLRPRPGSGD